VALLRPHHDDASPPEAPVTADDTPARRPRRTALLTGAGVTSGMVCLAHSPTLLLCVTALVLVSLSLVAGLALLAVLPRRKACRAAAERILRLLLIDTRRRWRSSPP